MVGLTTGNAADLGAGRNGWFVGHFLDDPMRHRADIELKWAAHRAGETKGTFAANRTATTISILIQGRFRLWFRPEGAADAEEVVLERPGDFALWGPGLPHDWRAEGEPDTETIILTVRSPSLPKDQAGATI